MEITKEAFDDAVRETIDQLIVALAEEEEVNPEKFYNVACILENLAFFSPVIYDLLQNPKKTS